MLLFMPLDAYSFVSQHFPQSIDVVYRSIIEPPEIALRRFLARITFLGVSSHHVKHALNAILEHAFWTARQARVGAADAVVDGGGR